MGFTGQLGTARSYLGNIELGGPVAGSTGRLIFKRAYYAPTIFNRAYYAPTIFNRARV